MPQIIEFDRKAFGAERSCLIEYLIKQDTGIKYSSAGIIEG
jgi:hypothetical protein